MMMMMMMMTMMSTQKRQYAEEHFAKVLLHSEYTASARTRVGQTSVMGTRVSALFCMAVTGHNGQVNQRNDARIPRLL